MKIIRVLCVLAGVAVWWGCGGGSSGPSQPTLNSITVTSSSATMWVALAQQFTATGHYSDGTTKDLTSVASWSSSPANMVSAGAGGALTPLSAGAVTIKASSGGATGSVVENIIGLTTAYISPSGAVLSLTGSPSSAQLSAVGVWADGKTVDVS